MGKALYRKYRSKKLSEIVGQDHITKTLENAIESGRISHAYLFTGPRGVGKTSIARILAHELNDLDYTDESIHLDIIEIDAASNRRIDEIRDLRDKVHISPTSAKYKIYIIDEVHMLTREAFNALLKTLEEPPAHAIFILATTELHKLPETIISRTQRFTFKPIDVAAAKKHLSEIAKSESLTIDDEALELLAIQGRGSFRDSISLLDQVSSLKNITKSDVEKLVGLAVNEHISGLFDAVTAGKPSDIVDCLEKLIEDGITPSQTAKQLSVEVRNKIIEGESSDQLIDLLADLVEVPASIEPSAALEIALFKARHNLALPEPQTEQKPKTVSQLTPVEPVVVATPEEVKQEQSAPSPKPESKKSKNTSSQEPADWWPEVLDRIKSTNNTLYGVLRMAKPELKGSELTLNFGFLFHKKKLSDASTQEKLNSVIEQITGQAFKITAVHDETASVELETSAAQSEAAPEPARQQPDDKPVSSDISSISNIFGGAEVLES